VKLNKSYFSQAKTLVHDETIHPAGTDAAQVHLQPQIYVPTATNSQNFLSSARLCKASEMYSDHSPGYSWIYQRGDHFKVNNAYKQQI